MRGPYGMQINDNCRTCKRRLGGFFCQLSSAALKDFDSIKSFTTYPEGAVLFLEKQNNGGVYLLCEGQVKLSISSSEGKTLILRIARPGEILGLLAALSGGSYEVSAETIHPCLVAYLRRDDFLRFISSHPEAYQAVIRQLSLHYQAACEQLRTVGLSASAPEKLAKLLLDWSASAKETRNGTPIKVPLTHEEIAEFIGTTRETVTRTLSEFRSRHLVAVHGSTMTIANREALASYVNA